MSFISRSYISKLLITLFSVSIAPILLAHEGHGGTSLVQHALEHGYMLLLPIAIMMITMTLRRRGKPNKKG